MKSILFFLLLCCNLMFCQETVLSTSDSIKKYFYNNPEKAITYSHKYLRLNEASNNTENIILGYSLLAASHEAMSQIDSTLYYYYKRLSLINKPKDVIENKFFIARIYENNYDYNEALRLYSQIIDLAKKENNDIIVEDIKFSIDLLKTKIGLNKKGLSKETFNYLKNQYLIQKKANDKLILRYNRKSLIEVYLSENNISEAILLINEGLEEAKQTDNLLFTYYMYEFRSKSYLLLKDLEKANKYAQKAMDYAIELKNEKFVNEINYRLADIAFLKNNYKQALINLRSIFKNDYKKSSLQASKYYKLKANVYKNLDSIRLSNTFYSKYIEEKEKASQEYLLAIESIHDITLKEQLSDVENTFKEELQIEILEKERHQKTKWIWTAMSGTLLLLIITLFLFYKNKSKVNQKRFDNLMLKINAFEERKSEENKNIVKQKEPAIETSSVKLLDNVEEIKDVKQQNKEPEDSSYTIDNKRVQEILNKLQSLEEKHYFLRQDCTLHNMAKRLKTNTSYLSKIINTHLDKSFSTYINELRINYAIIELKNSKRLRSYSVKAIAEEMGYKNADAFSRYFRSATGITPSVYIKKIQKI